MHVCSTKWVVFFTLFMVLQQGFGPQCLCLIFIDLPLMSAIFMSCRVQRRTYFSPSYCQLLEVPLRLVFRLRGTSGGNRPIRFFLPRRLNMEGKPALVGQFGVNRFFRRTRPTRRNQFTLMSPPKQKHMPFLPSTATILVGMRSSLLATSTPPTSKSASIFGLPTMSFRPLMRSKRGFTGSKITWTLSLSCPKDGKLA